MSKYVCDQCHELQRETIQANCCPKCGWNLDNAMNLLQELVENLKWAIEHSEWYCEHYDQAGTDKPKDHKCPYCVIVDIKNKAESLLGKEGGDE